MKRVLLLTLVSIFLLSCSKDDDSGNVETKQGIGLQFVKNKKLTSGEVTEERFTARVVAIWNSDGKDLTYSGPNDGTYAYDKISAKSYEAEYAYTNVQSKLIELPAGKYMIAFVTDEKEDPKLVYSYTTVEVKRGEYLQVKKNVTDMKIGTYTPW